MAADGFNESDLSEAGMESEYLNSSYLNAKALMLLALTRLANGCFRTVVHGATEPYWTCNTLFPWTYTAEVTDNFC